MGLFDKIEDVEYVNDNSLVIVEEATKYLLRVSLKSVHSTTMRLTVNKQVSYHHQATS